MFSKTKIFMIVAFAACLYTTEANAQLFRARTAGFGVGRSIVTRSSPVIQTGRIGGFGTQGVVGNQFGGRQSFGSAFRSPAVSRARSAFRVARIISAF